MFPPPITTAISTPSATTWAISSTMRSIVARLIPNGSLPMRASPLSLSSIRLYFAAAISGCFFGLGAFIFLRLAHLLHHFCGEIAGYLLDAFADHVQNEARHGGLVGLQQRFHCLLVVLHEGLSEQRDFLEKLLHAAFDHLRDNLGGLARLGGLCRGDAAFLFHQI